MKKVFRYIEHLWTGSDGKMSLRSVAAIALMVNFLHNTSFVIRKWDGNRSIADAAMLLGIEAGLIAAILGLKTYQSIQMKSKDEEGA